MEIPITGGWWSVAVLGLVWLIYLGLTWNRNYWKKRGIPYADPVPILGNLKDSVLMKKALFQTYEDLYWKFDGHKYGGVFTPKPSLLIRDPDLVKDILVREFTSFHDNTIEIDMKADPMFGRNPFVLRGESWKVTRSRLMPSFTASKLKAMFAQIPSVCQELTELLKNDSSGEFEAKDLCLRFTTNVVTLCAFGINGNSIKNSNSEFRRPNTLDPGVFNILKILATFTIPAVSKFLNTRLILKETENIFRRMVRDVMTYREKNDEIRNDYIQNLINIKNKETGNDHPFTDTDVAAQSITLFFDGTETSSIAFSLTLYCLATNPDVQTKLRNEVKSVIKEDGGELTYDNIQKMAYLEMVLSEALRLYTPLGFLSKVCTKPMELETVSGGKFTVEKGTSMVIPVSAIHRDPKYYPDPDTFNPENFSEENKKNRHKYAFLPFGEGPRVCLGRRFAVMQLKAGVASIVSNFEICTTSRTQVPVETEPASVLLGVKGGTWLKFQSLSD